uniref:CTCK domain-containing protein n=1 Tax=Leptobrachium leishanense TaxID=445787 RepID=A0A8C5RB33_9ANUR
MEKKDVGTFNCPHYKEPDCGEEILPMKIYENKDCCFRPICPGCNPNLCPEINLSCMVGHEPVLIPSECCLDISCVLKKVCVKDGIEYQPDTRIPSPPGSCEEYYCTNELDETSGFYIVSETTQICNTLCAPGQVYQGLPEQCCGKCVQVACVVTVPEIPDIDFTTPSEGYKIIPPGEVWYPTEDKCTGYTCAQVEGQLSTIVVNENCIHLGPESCEPGEDYRKHSGECCGHCVQLACVIIAASGRIIFLMENGTWTQDNKTCTSYACHRINGKLSTIATEIKCLHQSQEDCKTGEKYEIIAGQCCGHCVKTACVITSSSGEFNIIKAGVVFYSKDDVCTSYKCVNVSGQLEVVQEVETCAYKTADSCKPGSVFNKPGNQCCGTCVETLCFILTPSGEVKLLMVNDIWYPSNDSCTYYKCVQSEGQFFAVIVTQNCRYKSENDCNRNEEYVKLPKECCGICVKNSCFITTATGATKILKVGETWTPENDKCITYSCIGSQGQVVTSVMNKICPVITEKDCESGTMEMTSDGCCRVCKASKVCRRMFNSTLIEKNGCKLVENVPYCKGICAPSMTSLSPESGRMRDECECCTSTKVSQRQIRLQCPYDKRPLTHTYDYIENCDCKTVRCRD